MEIVLAQTMLQALISVGQTVYVVTLGMTAAEGIADGQAANTIGAVVNGVTSGTVVSAWQTAQLTVRLTAQSATPLTA